MATHNIISLHSTFKPKTGAERARAYRERKKSLSVQALPVNDVARKEHVEARPALRADKVLSRPAPRPAVQVPVPALRASVLPKEDDLMVVEVSHGVTIAGVTAPVTSRHAVTPSSILLSAAALALAGVGITMNGWFARSLGSTEIAGWLFLAIGVAADAAALGLPSCAARSWQAQQRGIALAGWGVWAATFVFALSASIGFASVNIADVTASRASRITPAIVTAQAALADAMVARDRECKGGVGRFCREREAAVADRRQALDVATEAVAQGADPQVAAAIKVVSFLTGGALHPTSDDFALVRLLLLAFLPQVGGILLMVGRAR